MTKKNPFNIDFGAIGDAMKDLQNAYSNGLGAMNQAGKEMAEEMEPSHRIIVDVKVSAQTEGHDYGVDTHLEFLADLNSILQSQSGDIMSLLSGLNADLSEEDQAMVAKQLGKPKCIAVIDQIDTKKLLLYSEDGRENAKLNKDGTMLISLDKEVLSFSFESVLSFPELAANKTLYFSIPSMEKMQKNIKVPLNKLDKKVSYKWNEKDKDNLKIEGTLKLESLG